MLGTWGLDPSPSLCSGPVCQESGIVVGEAGGGRSVQGMLELEEIVNQYGSGEQKEEELVRLTSIYTTSSLLLLHTIFYFIRIPRIFLHHLGLPLLRKRR